MPSRVLDFPVFDADNHLYETTEAFIKFLPSEYDGLIEYVEVRGRTKIAVKGQISDFIPNPTFEVVAAPGAQEEYFKHGNPEGKSRREMMGKAIRSRPAFRDPEPRLQLMDELGIDRALMWPTLASLLEERLRNDHDATHAVIHALNQWMHEHWTFNYENRIFPVPVITLPIVAKAVRGAGVGARARRSGRSDPPCPRSWRPGFPVLRPAGVRPFLEESGGSGDPGRHARVRERLPALYQRMGRWDRGRVPSVQGCRAGWSASGFAAIRSHPSRPIFDAVASIIGHGLATRFPELRFMPVENGSDWVRPLRHA